MNIRLDGKRALVTGAGKGIGRAISKQLVECGADTFALSRTKADLDSLVNEVPSIHVICIDLTDWNRTREEIAHIGPLDFLINNAGTITASSFLDTSKEELERIIDIDFKAAYNVAQIVANGMVSRGTGGSIINISSALSMSAFYPFSAYCCTKAALDMLTRCMALELGPKNIRVNGVNPSLVWTPCSLKYAKGTPTEHKVLERTPLGKVAEIDDIVNTVIYLLSDNSAMITGQCIKVDGGFGVH